MRLAFVSEDGRLSGEAADGGDAPALDWGDLLRRAREAAAVQSAPFDTASGRGEARVVALGAGGAAPRGLVLLLGPDETPEALAALQRESRRNDAILRSAMDGFFVVDEQCRFLKVNTAFCRMLGYTEEELLRMCITDLEVRTPEASQFPYARTGLHQFPTAHRHKDGRVVHLEISVNVLRDGAEKVLVGFARDVTERNRTAEALARLTAQQRLILNCAAEGIAGIDERGMLSFVNPAGAQMLGAQSGELLGAEAHRVLYGGAARSDECRRADCPLCRTLRDGERTVRGQGEFFRGDGGRVPVEYSLNLMGESAAGAGAVLVFRDMTEQRRVEEERRALEQQMQHAHKMESLGLLAGGIAHDLNNMMVGILGNACLALAQPGDPQLVTERLQRIVSACERASKVIRQILAYAGHLACEVEPLDLNARIADMTDFMRAAVPRSITLCVETDSEPLVISADDGQLQQVLMNLIINGVEAIGDRPGRITVRTRALVIGGEESRRLFPGQEVAAGSYAVFDVEDDGCGMSAETVQRVFEPFFSQKGAGRGLGLAAMRGIVRAHRGGVRIESEPGRGTRVTVAFPLMPRTETVSEREPRSVHTRAATVLVIDDEEDVREVIESMLTLRGYHVLAADNGARGVELFEKHADSIDVVILDMTMPGKSGPEVYRDLLAIRPDAKIIIASGYSEHTLPARLGDSRPVPFIPKPFTTETLLDRIHEALGQELGASG